ncbi:MAG: polysaccharide deacetylase family protein [Campylobacterales bacterium]|nr:polysaccharide deacetylase family protein [Campylobacterales bacterium]
MDRRFFTKLCLGSAASMLMGSEDETHSTKRDVEIFLTVDDGWNHKQTILDIANHYKVPLNLFIIGKVIEKDPKVWQNAIEKGHMLGSHTYNHHKLSKIDEETIEIDFKDYKKCVINTLGHETFDKIKFFRYPYGDTGNRLTKPTTKKMIEDSGWKTSWWNMDLSFASYSYGVRAYKDPNDQLTYFSRNIKHISVPLFHFKDPDVKAIELIIKYGLENGYKFSRLDSKKSFI